MFQSFEQARRYIDEYHIEVIDLKFCDLWGRWHHLTVPSSQFTSDLMVKGIGLDGSAVGLKSVKAGDMVLIPDLSTATNDPFWEAATLTASVLRTASTGLHTIFPAAKPTGTAGKTDTVTTFLCTEAIMPSCPKIHCITCGPKFACISKGWTCQSSTIIMRSAVPVNRRLRRR